MLLNMQVIGYLAKDAIKREVNGKIVINFSIPYNEKYTNRTGQQVENTVWVECSWWTQSTGLLPYLTKGSIFYVDGTPSARSYVNKQGQTVNQLGLMVKNIRIIKSSGDSQNNQQPEQQVTVEPEKPTDLPF